MELANKLGARFTLIVGDNEMAAGRYALKNMATGEQESLDARGNRRAHRNRGRQTVGSDRPDRRH